ncbi:MAG: amidophosphoribosyltransferase [Candidatus Sumerlaeaceae bacterium]|nr:amidophosphoribosyltransferase [Candidatus Sumerlaeaceae bacterium]
MLPLSDDFAREMPHEECGIVGVYNHPEAAKLAYLGLYALQHRGQESAGIVSSDGERLYSHKAAGLVADVFNEKNLATLQGDCAIGHVRYSTTGSSISANAQPILANYKGGTLSLAHNGNITNADELRAELEERGAIFQTTTDTEILVHMIAQAGARNFDEALFLSLMRLKGAYSLVVLRPDGLLALKDPRGFRPLCLGKLGDGYVVASESCAFDIMNAQYLRELTPGEVIAFRGGAARSSKPFPAADQSFCIFEYIYFSRPDSMALTRSVAELRTRLGAQLAEEQPADADIVIAVPDSSTSAAIGYSQQSGIPYAIGLVRSHYVGRTFIEPDQNIRDFGARVKYNPVRSVLQDKRVVVVDDSIVRGTTSRKIVNLLRSAGAREIHFRVSAPPWKNPCYFGIDTPEPSKLIGATARDNDEIRKFVGADTLGFISVEGLQKVMPKTQGYCMACFTGEYPDGQRPSGEFTKDILESGKRHG